MRKRTDFRMRHRLEKKRLRKLQIAVNFEVGPRVIKEHLGQVVDQDLLQAVRRAVIHRLLDAGWDMDGVDIYPVIKGRNIALRVGPRAPVVLGREDDERTGAIRCAPDVPIPSF